MNDNLPSPEALEALEALEAMEPIPAAAFWVERLQRYVPGETDAFEAWKAASAANADAWERVRELWDILEEPDTDGVLADIRRAALAARGRPAKAPVGWYLVAASVAALVVGGVLVSGLGRERLPLDGAQVASATSRDLHAFGRADYETGPGQRLNVRLDDGSKLELKEQTTVDIAYVDGQRLVRLTRGEALFDVKHDANHPFRVAAGGRVVSDLGTRFNIRVQGGETRVRLDEGSLGVTIGDDPHRVVGTPKILVPGQELVARAGRTDDIIANLLAVSDWGSREIVQFDNVTLAQAVAQLNQRAQTKLVINDPKVAALRISGSFPGDSAVFAETLTLLYPVRLVRLPDGRTEIAMRGKSKR